MDVFDAVVVGAGPAGCLVGRRLADAGLDVALFEAGNGVKPPEVSSWDATRAASQPSWYWDNLVAVTGNGQPVTYRAGRGLGGGSAVNYMVLSAGASADYHRDSGPTQGSATRDVAPIVGQLLDQIKPTVPEYGPLAKAIGGSIARAGDQVVLGIQPEVGYWETQTSAGFDVLGFVPVLMAGANGVRRSAAEVFLADAPSNLVVCPNTEVSTVVVSPDGCVEGVAVVGENGLRHVLARTVVLCGGTIHNPALLVRSGLLAPGTRLEVMDHPSFSFVAQLGLGAGGNPDYDGGSPSVSAMYRWMATQPGRGAITSLVADNVGVGDDGLTYGAVIMTLDCPRSVGYLVASSASGGELVPGWLDHADDKNEMVAGVRYLADFLLSPDVVGPGGPVDAWFVDDKGTKLKELIDRGDAAMGRWLVSHPGPVAHLVGSCAGLVQGALSEVLSAAGLHIIDGSVLSQVPSGPPQLPIMVKAERVAGRLVASLQ